tara:strand:+ start:1127 stop:4768 length:3642 start_codon:yes stop_codon:yes gene_type:complete
MARLQYQDLSPDQIDWDATYKSQNPNWVQDLTPNQIDWESTESRRHRSVAHPAPEPDLIDTAAIIGLEIAGPVIGGIVTGANPAGIIAGGALGNLASQKYRISRGFQEDVGLGELGAATALSALPVGTFVKGGASTISPLARSSIRAGQGAVLAPGELLARTYIDEDRAPTEEELITTVLFGGAFGGTLGALEAKFLNSNLGINAEQGDTRPVVRDKIDEKIDQVGGAENYASIAPALNPLGPRRKVQVVPQEGIDTDLPIGLPAPKQGRDVVIDVEATEVNGEKILNSLEQKFFIEAESQLSRLARQRGEEATGAMSEIQKRMDDMAIEDQEIFSPLMRTRFIGAQKIGDNRRFFEIQEEIARLDHQHGPGKGAGKQRKRLADERKRLLKRNNLQDIDNLEEMMRAGQMPPNVQKLEFGDKPMKQADPPTKSEKQAEDFLGTNYPKYFNMAFGLGITGASLGSLFVNQTDEEKRQMQDLKKAGFDSPMFLMLIAAALGYKGFKRFKKSSQFKKAQAQARVNPKMVEPDTVTSKRVQDALNKQMFSNPSEFNKFSEDGKKILTNLLTPLSRRLKSIAKPIARRFRNHDKLVGRTIAKYLDRGTPFVTRMTKLLKPHPKDVVTGDKKDLGRFLQFKAHLSNGNFDAVKQMVKDSSLSDTDLDKALIEFTNMQKALRDLRDYARKEGGIDVGDLGEFYFPREVKNPKSFRKYLDANLEDRDIRNQIEVALDEYAEKNGLASRDLIDDYEYAEIANRVLRGFPTDETSALPGNFKPRTIEEIGPDFIDAYQDPADAMKSYIEKVVTFTERNKFLGRGGKPGVASGKDLGMDRKIDDTLAGQVAKDLGRENNLNREDVEKLKDIINARFSGEAVGSFVQGLKNANYIQVMGNFGSAITQLGELAYSIHFNGMGNTFRTLFNKKDNFDFVKHFNLSDRDVDSVTSAGMLSSALDSVFSFVQLKKLDQLSKNTIMNASVLKYKKVAKNNPASLIEELTPVFGKDDSKKMVLQLLNTNPSKGKIPELVEELVYYKFLDLNPATLTEMPAGYVGAGAGRLFYMLKTFTIKQFDVYREAGLDEINEGLKKYSEGQRAKGVKQASDGMKKLVGLATVFAAANAGTDVIKDTLYGRPIKPDELVENNLLRLVFINRYLKYKAERDGIGRAVFEFALPPTAVFDRAGQDIFSIIGDGEYKGAMLQGTPLDMVYWRQLGGLDKIKD